MTPFDCVNCAIWGLPGSYDCDCKNYTVKCLFLRETKFELHLSQSANIFSCECCANEPWWWSYRLGRMWMPEGFPCMQLYRESRSWRIPTSLVWQSHFCAVSWARRDFIDIEAHIERVSNERRLQKLVSRISNYFRVNNENYARRMKYANEILGVTDISAISSVLGYSRILFSAQKFQLWYFVAWRSTVACSKRRYITANYIHSSDTATTCSFRSTQKRGSSTFRVGTSNQNESDVDRFRSVAKTTFTEKVERKLETQHVSISGAAVSNSTCLRVSVGLIFFPRRYWERRD